MITALYFLSFSRRGRAAGGNISISRSPMNISGHSDFRALPVFRCRRPLAPARWDGCLQLGWRGAMAEDGAGGRRHGALPREDTISRRFELGLLGRRLGLDEIVKNMPDEIYCRRLSREYRGCGLSIWLRRFHISCHAGGPCRRLRR